MIRRATWGAIAVAASALMATPVIVPMRPLLLWNATASTPVGLYVLRPAQDLRTGELVAAMPPQPIASFLARGGFLPRGVPLLKHVAALSGQTICRFGDTVTIGGNTVAQAHDLDSHGHPLPRWQGCRTLTKGEVFLMNSAVPDSLDGRYFGSIPASSIVGRAIPVWLPHAAGVRASPAVSPSSTRNPKGTPRDTDR